MTRRRSVVGTRLADHLELTKPRITLMVVLTAAVGFLLAADGRAWPPPLLLHTLVGTGLVAAGASALNQFAERTIDARMRRTAGRPLPAGRLAPDESLVFAVVLTLAGLAELIAAVNPLTALLGAATTAGYLFVYTPLKRTTWLAVLVGAVPGAIPPMMGWAALRGGLGAGAWALFGILFLWQLPHFLAIAWLYREDYARGGFPMLPVVDPQGERTAKQMVLWCAALLPVSITPTALGLTGPIYLLGALGLGIYYLVATFRFARHRSAPAARRLLLTSVIYLPALLSVLFADRLLL
jgi:protoheme IX farnesyltransferase